MALAIIIIGLLLVSVGIQDKQAQLGSLLKSDFTGAGSFWYFVAGLFIVGALGYWSPFRTASRGLILLILVVLILSNRGVFANLQSALSSPAASAPAASSSAAAASGPAPATPGLALNPFAGLPGSWSQFFSMGGAP